MKSLVSTYKRTLILSFLTLFMGISHTMNMPTSQTIVLQTNSKENKDIERFKKAIQEENTAIISSIIEQSNKETLSTIIDVIQTVEPKKLNPIFPACARALFKKGWENFTKALEQEGVLPKHHEKNIKMCDSLLKVAQLGHCRTKLNEKTFSLFLTLPESTKNMLIKNKTVDFSDHAPVTQLLIDFKRDMPGLLKLFVCDLGFLIASLFKKLHTFKLNLFTDSLKNRSMLQLFLYYFLSTFEMVCFMFFYEKLETKVLSYLKIPLWLLGIRVNRPLYYKKGPLLLVIDRKSSELYRRSELLNFIAAIIVSPLLDTSCLFLANATQDFALELEEKTAGYNPDEQFIPFVKRKTSEVVQFVFEPIISYLENMMDKLINYVDSTY